MNGLVLHKVNRGVFLFGGIRMSNVDKVWDKILNYEEPIKACEELREIYKTIIYSPNLKTAQLRDFLEKVDEKSLINAIGEIYWIPAMEVGEEDDDDLGERYYLYANSFREQEQIDNIKQNIWWNAKPKGKKTFFLGVLKYELYF